ncbi:hypothetical protein MASR2M18_17640 [Ignavibacteria bacterium]|jgi:hypothetical protein|nr:hypothetical protein [Bacteroidota bacterium]MCZ2132868.1 hypothetical protein [Bacteroidota bacterium]
MKSSDDLRLLHDVKTTYMQRAIVNATFLFEGFFIISIRIKIIPIFGSALLLATTILNEADSVWKQ